MAAPSKMRLFVPFDLSTIAGMRPFADSSVETTPESTKTYG